ncbi:DUF4245 domain-containing protein [Agreia pratensis]|uniref:DUF4245 domain-containing protein n=1 Tax=Agreia pratensis TaxID=150121 RepID=A0A1X7KKZ6_9MICO|nr:DUF4245 domain-containing protein [Agreia pratensis]MBF4634590.1 DUF4245 domain-containing protein [Agreia pratensis]SMG41811.1 Protein of unknown function [Agreia pratensis]
MARREPKPRPIVAELGRPETPEEEAARKAQNSKNYRDSKTIRNLWVAVGVTVAIVALMIFIVPRDDSSRLQSIDYRSVAVSAQRTLPVPLAVPELPDTWSSNVAEIRTASLDGVTSWFIGLITPSKQFLSITQAVDANPSWLVNEMQQTIPTGTVNIDGIDWIVYDNRDSDRDVGNVEYALTTESGRSTFIVAGTATPEEAAALASTITTTIEKQTTEATS